MKRRLFVATVAAALLLFAVPGLARAFDGAPRVASAPLPVRPPPASSFTPKLVSAARRALVTPSFGQRNAIHANAVANESATSATQSLSLRPVDAARFRAVFSRARRSTPDTLSPEPSTPKERPCPRARSSTTQP